MLLLEGDVPRRLRADYSARLPSGSDGSEDWLDAHDIEDPSQVIGEYVQRHFG